MKRKIVVGGNAYADIDVIACASAYKHLLQILGEPASAVITPPLNASVPFIMYHWLSEIEKEFIYKTNECHFILVDVSDPHHLNDFVQLENIIEVFDHHYGFQDYWQQKLTNNVYIESVGACATLIWEQYKKINVENKITSNNANLLYTAIVANTLNFKAAITHTRDIIAAHEILPFTALTSDWIDQYYNEIQKKVIHDPLKSLAHDTKTVTISHEKVIFGQLELYDASPLLNTLQKQWNEYLNTYEYLKGTQPKYILSIVSIKENRNYIITSDIVLNKIIMNITNGILNKELLVTPRLWLRKEILKEIINQERS